MMTNKTMITYVTLFQHNDGMVMENILFLY